MSKVTTKKWDLIIEPQQGLLDVNFKEIWNYRDLLFLFVKRDVVTVYKQTVLGPIWFFCTAYHDDVGVYRSLW